MVSVDEQLRHQIWRWKMIMVVAMFHSSNNNRMRQVCLEDGGPTQIKRENLVNMSNFGWHIFSEFSDTKKIHGHSDWNLDYWKIFSLNNKYKFTNSMEINFRLLLILFVWKYFSGCSGANFCSSFFRKASEAGVKDTHYHKIYIHIVPAWCEPVICSTLEFTNNTISSLFAYYYPTNTLTH